MVSTGLRANSAAAARLASLATSSSLSAYCRLSDCVPAGAGTVATVAGAAGEVASTTLNPPEKGWLT